MYKRPDACALPVTGIIKIVEKYHTLTTKNCGNYLYSVILHSMSIILLGLCPFFDEQFIFVNFYLVFLILIITLIWRAIFCTLLVVMRMCLFKPLKRCMYFWFPRIACINITLLYINYTTNGFLPVVQKRILDIMLPGRTSLLRESFLVGSLVYISSLYPRFANLF